MGTSPGTRPACTCHNEPMHSNGSGGWRCAEINRSKRRAYHVANRERENARSRTYDAAHPEDRKVRYEKWYYGQSGVAYNGRLLQSRRLKALQRMATRGAI